MPWFPDFVGAVELTRRQTRAAGQADPVAQYLTALNQADTHALEDVWPGQVVVYDPHAGEIHGHRQLHKFLRQNRPRLGMFRTYTSQWPIDEQRHIRAPILQPGPVRPGDVVGRYHDALTAGDAEAIVATFAPDGYFHGPFGPDRAHHGTAELRSFFTRCFSAGGGIALQHCAMTDDGARCALEYNCVRWGTTDLPPQAGLGVHERGP